jgi:hypothetical protein
LGYLQLSDDYYSPEFATKADQLPGALIIQREIRKAAKGEDFFYNDEDTGKPMRCQGIPMEAFSYYYRIWENFHYFGLPAGRGWQAEREWMLEFLKIFEKAHKSVLHFLEMMAMKKGGM